MPSVTSNDSKKAILYARVSKEESAKSGYSLAQQLEALRSYAVHKGHEVLEEVEDPGYTGASLVRPGMDRVRDLVERGGVDLVFAQDADRITREPYHRALLDEEFANHGCALRALDDWGDDSHEGTLLKFIKAWQAKGERLKIAERTRRGLLRKVREGKVIKGPKPNFGFRWNKSEDMLVVYSPEMRLVERIFRMAGEEAMGPKAIQTRLYKEGIPSPTGKLWWAHRIIKHQLILNDLYRPHTFEEVGRLVSPELVEGLDPDGFYGIWWWNRRAVTKDHSSATDRNGDRRYRPRTATKTKDREDWVAVPVPVSKGPSRELVDRAREMMTSRSGNERKHRTRQWELKNLVRCSCGQLMILNASRAKGREPYYYYRCRRSTAYGSDACSQRGIRSERIEPPVWELVAGILKKPARLRRGLEEMLKRERRQAREGASDDVEREIQQLREELSKAAHLRRAYQDQQAAPGGLMTLDELCSRLREVEEARETAEARIASLQRSREWAEELENRGKAILTSLEEEIPEALDELTGDERNALYRMLRLEVMPAPEGFQVTGVLLPSETQSCG